MAMKFAALADHLIEQVSVIKVLGIGTGRTVDAVLQALQPLLVARSGEVTLVASSFATARTCGEMGLHSLHPGTPIKRIDLYLDGADEIDERCRLIKGRGGAMLREKILASLSDQFIVLADDTKRVAKLGSKFPIPIEVIPEALELVLRELEAIGALSLELRSGAPGKHGPCVTESGNIIVDARFPEVAEDLESRIKSIVGVVESGLFLTQASEALVLGSDGVITALSGNK